MKQFIIAILLMVASFSMGQSLPCASLAQETNENVSLWDALAAHNGVDPTSWTVNEFRAEARSFATYHGMVYDQSAKGNLAILHKINCLKTIEIGGIDTVAIAQVVVDTFRPDTVVVDSHYAQAEPVRASFINMSPLCVYSISGDTVRSCSMDTIETVFLSTECKANNGKVVRIKQRSKYSKAVSLYHMHFEAWMPNGDCQDRRDAEQAWRAFVKDIDKGTHPADLLPCGHDGLERFLRGKKKAYWAWQELSVSKRNREWYLDALDDSVMVFPIANVGGGVAMPMGNGLSKVKKAIGSCKNAASKS